jgi:cell division protein ZapA
MQSSGTTVMILGQEYTVRSEGDPQYVREIAQYVDRRMREVSQASQQVSSTKIAILAALNIADELFRERRQTGSGVEHLQERAEHLLVALEESFKKGGETLPGA